MVGVSLDGLITTVLPATSAATVMPTRIASGKFHGGMITPTPSGRYSSSSFSPGNLHHRIGLGQAQHLARVVLAEIDGFGNIGVRFRPRFAGFVDQPGVELKLALANQRGRAQQHSARVSARRRRSTPGKYA